MPSLAQRIEQPANKSNLPVIMSSPKPNSNRMQFPSPTQSTTTDHVCMCTQHYHNISATVLQPNKKKTNFHHHHHHHPSITSCTSTTDDADSTEFESAQQIPFTSYHIPEITSEPKRSSLSVDDTSTATASAIIENHQQHAIHHHHHPHILISSKLNTVANVALHPNVRSSSSSVEFLLCGECNGNGCSVCINKIHPDHQHSENSSKVVSTDENNPDDNNFEKSSSRLNKNQIYDEAQRKQQSSKRSEELKFINRIEQYSDGDDSAVKVVDGATSEEELGPPLPPRPPPRPRNVQASDEAPHGTGLRKYVVWCLICGGISCLLGIMFLGVYFLVRSYTSTVGYFETVPTFVPATLLMLTGLCIMSLARRRNRYSYLIKLSGACGLASALTCALVTVTTTVLHMSRLQALKECEYTKKTRTCTCYPIVNDPQQSDDGVDEVAVRFVFDSSDECTIVHSALYACLRAVFGLSVAGVLVAVFSCMLVYQLLSHERKKMYWEQLELRCRSLYTGPQPPPSQVTGAPSIIGTPRGGPCRCCEQCHSHRNVLSSAYPWDGDNRFWGPVPGQGGNFYSPNPVGDDSIGGVANRTNQVTPRNQRPGWSWPRLPWQRNDAQRFRQTPSSPDSQYGFSNGNTLSDPVNMQAQSIQGGYSVISGPPHYGIWGPPPPYSDPNSPARRGRYQYIHPSQCQQIIDHNNAITQPSNLAILECHQHNASTDGHSIMEPFCSQQQLQQQQQLLMQQQQQQQQQQLQQHSQTHHRSMIKRQNVNAFKMKDHYESTPSDSDGPRDRFSNTLPIRKIKKRIEIGAKSIGPNQTAARVNVQNVFAAPSSTTTTTTGSSMPLPIQQSMNDSELFHHDEQPMRQCHSSVTKQQRHKLGIENSAFIQADDKQLELPESEVYFADVSSCCNVSVKNDNFYDETNPQHQQLPLAQNQRGPHCNNSGNSKEVNEDYLVQRFGKREASIRSRLPFPQVIPDDYEKPQMNIPKVSTASRPTLIHKDISRQSMCSVDSGEKTDITDLSPATPCSAFGNVAYTIDDNAKESLTFQHIYPNTTMSNSSQFSNGKYIRPDYNDGINANFISSSPFSSYTSGSSCTNNDLQTDVHRRTIIGSTAVNSHKEMYLAPDAQYDISTKSLTSNNSSSSATALTLSYDHHDMSTVYNNGNNGNQPSPQLMSSHHYLQKPKSPNSMNITPIKRQSLGTNISAIIQNLGGSDVGLLYPDNRREDEHNNSQQDCSKSITKKSISDNGWSSDHSSDRRL